MLRFPASIRQKVMLGYYVLLALIVVLSVFTFMELRYLENKITLGEAIPEFFNTTLEIRRFEKNYFLYGKDDDYQSNRVYVKKALALIKEKTSGFQTIMRAEEVSSLRESLRQYGLFMDTYAGTDKKRMPSAGERLEERIRDTGKELVTTAERISRAERRNLQAILSSSEDIIIFSLVSLCIMGVVISQVLSRMIVKPLELMEKSMKAISEGGFERIQIHSKDREIVSLAGAINRMLRELESRQRHLIQSEKLASLGTLLSGVAHELNNPLSNISTSSQILMEELAEKGQGASKEGGEKVGAENAASSLAPGPLSIAPEFVLELLSQIEEQTERARNIVRSLLDFSRPKDFKKELIPLRALFQETIRFIKGQLPVSVEIRLQIPEEISIMADKQRMQQAFLNLIKNAVEAVEGEGMVFIKAEKHPAREKSDYETELYDYLRCRGTSSMEEETVDIEIRDTGPGIAAELLSRVFDPFFSTKEVGKGSGLGLFIVHEVIEEHEGCIGVESEAGKGTGFLIRLPI